MNLDKRIDEIASHKIWLPVDGVERATNEDNELVTVIPQDILVNRHNELKQSIKQLIEEEKIKELGNLLSKKDEFIPDLTFKKIKDRIKELENK